MGAHLNNVESTAERISAGLEVAQTERQERQASLAEREMHLREEAAQDRRQDRIYQQQMVSLHMFANIFNPISQDFLVPFN